jgi:general secretion pathway protein I
MPQPGKRAGSRAGGFSLIEVLAALIIVALGMLGVIEAVSQTAGNTAYLRDKTIAHWIAMNRLTELRLEQQAPEIAKSSDEVEMANRRWRWTMEVTQTPLQSMRRIDISVRPADAAEDSSLAAVTGFYGSAIAAAGTTTLSWQGAAGPPAGDDDDPPGDPPQQDPPPQDPPQQDPPQQDPSLLESDTQ